MSFLVRSIVFLIARAVVHALASFPLDLSRSPLLCGDVLLVNLPS
jgi:hypothetical protein